MHKINKIMIKDIDWRDVEKVCPVCHNFIEDDYIYEGTNGGKANCYTCGWEGKAVELKEKITFYVKPKVLQEIIK